MTNLVLIMNDGQSNYGFLWILNPEQKYRSVFAASSDYADAAKRPKLVVTYAPMKKYFYLKDNLGNIRVTVDENGDVKGYNDYYPFGLRMPGRSMNTALNYALYKYSSKELDEENGINWYYFGARYYDPAIGRWLSVDPLAKKYPGISPYVFTLNNPIKYYDPDGNDIKTTIKGLGQFALGGTGFVGSFTAMVKFIPPTTAYNPYLGASLATFFTIEGGISFMYMMVVATNIYNGIIDKPEISSPISFALQKFGISKKKADAIQLIYDSLHLKEIGKNIADPKIYKNILALIQDGLLTDDIRNYLKENGATEEEIEQLEKIFEEKIKSEEKEDRKNQEDENVEGDN